MLFDPMSLTMYYYVDIPCGYNSFLGVFFFFFFCMCNVGWEEKSCHVMYVYKTYMYKCIHIYTYAKIPQIFMRTHNAAAWPAAQSIRWDMDHGKVLPQWMLVLLPALFYRARLSVVVLFLFFFFGGELQVCSATFIGRLAVESWN